MGGASIGSKGSALVDEQLRTWTVGAGVCHLPIVVFVESLHPLGAHADLVDPDLFSLVVAQVHRDPEVFRVKTQYLGCELPRKRDGVGLEVVTEAEVSHHLEEGEMAFGATNFVEVVVFTAGSGALLHSDCTFVRRGLFTDEVRLERHHARDREHHGGVMWNQTRTLDRGVVLGHEIVSERFA